VTVRLARILVDLATSHGFPTSQGLDAGIELSQPELAALIGAAEPSVQRSLRELRNLELLATGYRRFVITDLKKVSEFARLSDDANA
jgi:CRP/FNR family cyclic AMP-dependent transcriptional regulator